MVKIYTKTGDKGETSLLGGKRVSKDDARVSAYGSVDELNSIIGMAGVQASEHCELIQKIQSSLFDLGAQLSCPIEEREKFKIKGIKENLVEEMEKEIDKMNLKLEELKSFILPGGHESSARFHWARTVVRRVERELISLYKNDDEQGKVPLVFLNRLSDLFFVMARFYNLKNCTKDVIWIG